MNWETAVAALAYTGIGVAVVVAILLTAIICPPCRCRRKAMRRRS